MLLQSGEWIALEGDCLSVLTGWVTETIGPASGLHNERMRDNRQKLKQNRERGYNEKLAWMQSPPLDFF